MKTIDSVRIVNTHTGEKVLMIFTTDSDRKTTVIYWPEDIRKLVCEKLAFELAYQLVYGHPCNEDDYNEAKQFEDVIYSTLVSGLNDGSLTLTQAQSILVSVGLPTEGFVI